MAGVASTPGGRGAFMVGAIVVVGAAYLLTQRDPSEPGSVFAPRLFRLSVLPLLVGVACLLHDGLGRLGWTLTGLSTAVVCIGMLAHWPAHFEPTRFIDTLLMLAFLAGGLGLLALSRRSLSPR